MSLDLEKDRHAETRGEIARRPISSFSIYILATVGSCLESRAGYVALPMSSGILGNSYGFDKTLQDRTVYVVVELIRCFRTGNKRKTMRDNNETHIVSVQLQLSTPLHGQYPWRSSGTRSL